MKMNMIFGCGDVLRGRIGSPDHSPVSWTLFHLFPKGHLVLDPDLVRTGEVCELPRQLRPKPRGSAARALRPISPKHLPSGFRPLFRFFFWGEGSL